MIAEDEEAKAMKVAFQIILLAVILLGAIGAVGEREDRQVVSNMLALCISAIIGFIVASIVL